MKEHYDKVCCAKVELLKQGFVKYDEAYSIAFSHLRKHPQLINLFAKRFPLVFIDEMQDMEVHQSKLINYLFGKGTSIIQKIGDVNQSIFSPNSEQEQSDWDTTVNSLSLNQTTRLSHHLAEIVKPVCLSPQSMEGNWNPFPLIKPTIIIFDDNTKENVKEEFARLIISHKLNEIPNAKFKAIGYRKSMVSNDKLNINSYWSDFNKSSLIKKREEFDNLFSYLEKCQVLSQEKNVKEIRKTLLSAICKALKIAEIKNPSTNYYFTPFTITQYLSSEKEVENKLLTTKLSKWILDFQSKIELRTEIADYIKTLLDLFQKQPTQKFNEFLTDTVSSTQALLEPCQIYEHEGVKIHFDTIHGAKGETHTATLYLETFYDTFDIGVKILDFISSNEKRQTSWRTKPSYKSYQNKLPFAYVAMSRSTHFLCLAVHEDRFKDGVKVYFEDLEKGWDLHYI